MAKLKSFFRSPLKIIIALVIIALVVVGVLIYHHNHIKTTSNTSGSQSTSNKPAPAADNNANNERKGSSSPSGTLDNGSSNKPTSMTPSFQVEIVNSNVADGNLHIGTMVSGTTTGSCSLTATQTGQATLQLGTSTVHQDVNSYDCGVFNISTSKFPTNGSWNIILSVTSSGATISASTNVNIQK